MSLFADIIDYLILKLNPSWRRDDEIEHWQTRKPLLEYRDQPEGILIPNDVLIDLARSKHLLLALSFIDFTAMDFLSFLVNHLPFFGSGVNFKMLIKFVKRININNLRSKWPELEFNKGHKSIIVSNLKKVNPVDKFIQIIDQELDYGGFLIFGFDHLPNDSCKNHSMVETDFFKVMLKSKYFLFVDFDTVLLLGLEKELGYWHPKILELVES